jgi:hypothetical protein
MDEDDDIIDPQDFIESGDIELEPGESDDDIDMGVEEHIVKSCEQLESGCLPLIKDYSKYDNIYDIALEELNEKKIPFILKRFINGKYEYWKLEDMIY